MAGSLEEARLWLEKAEGALNVASALVGLGFYGEVVSRAYYAMFYAAKAAVLGEGFQSRKHSTVIAAFGRLFARTARLDPRLHKALAEAFRERHAIDYRLGVVVSENEARTRLEIAGQFVQSVRRLLDL